ncbi:MAG: CDF family Co(II)/Ni(II) efflux transporter DmeF [Polyangiales bacterium]
MAADTSPSLRCLQPVVVHGGREGRTRWVVGITVVMMVAELVVGTLTRSLALTADGWHMGSHAGALGLSALAYWYARTRAKADHFSFGTGKVLALAGYTNAVMLAGIAVWMLIEAGARMLHPVAVDFGEALPVAVLGLVVNLACVALLGVGADHHHADGDHGHRDHGHDHGHGHDHAHREHAHDVNHRAAYMHILADALTSVLAIAALVAGRYFEVRSLDPWMAVVGSVIILRWSYGLCKDSTKQLLDVTPSPEVAKTVRAALEGIGDTRVIDLHLWQLGGGSQGCIASIVTSEPRPLDEYRELVREVAKIDHLTIEVDRCANRASPPA